MPLRFAVADLISPSYFPLVAAAELGYLEKEGIDADLDLVFPVTRAYEQLQDGSLDFVAGSAHATLRVFPRWQGARLLCALSQQTYWFLVVRSDLGAEAGDLSSVAGLRIGAAPGPADALRWMLQLIGLDPDRDCTLAQVPRSGKDNVSFGVAAARALEQGGIDGFWANGMAADMAVRSGVGTILIDARRGGGPPGSAGLTFPALVAGTRLLAEDKERARAAVRGVVAAQRALTAHPERAFRAAARFPDHERTLIAGQIRRDAPFYDPRITRDAVSAMHAFAAAAGILEGPEPAYEQAVAVEMAGDWQS